MEDIRDRIYLLRKREKLSQEKFGARIGVSRDVIKNLELKLTEPKEPMINLICKEFGIAQTWLITGKGEMYPIVPNKYAEFDAYHLGLSDLPDADFKKKVYNVLMKLTDEQWDFLENIVALLMEAENAKKEEGE